MSMEFDESATPEEKEKAWREAHDHIYNLFYKRAIESGASIEEAVKRATYIRNNIAL